VEYLLVVLIVFAAGLIHGSAGFAFALVATPLLSFLFPIRQTVAFTMLLAFVFSAQILARYHREIPWRVIWLPLLVSYAGRLVGVSILMNLDTRVFRLIWGAALILFAVYFGLYKQRIRIRPSVPSGIVVGALSGVLGGMFNTGGPPVVVYYYCAISGTKAYSAALQVTFFTGAVINFFMHLGYGNITVEVIKWAGVGVLAVAAGIFIGIRVFERVDRRQLGSLISVLIGALGLVQIIKAAGDLWS